MFLLVGSDAGLKKEIGEFLHEIYPLLHKETPTTSMLQVLEQHGSSKHVICQLLKEVIEWAKELVEAGYLYEVSVYRYSNTQGLYHSSLSGTTHSKDRYNVPGGKGSGDLPRRSFPNIHHFQRCREGWQYGKTQCGKGFCPTYQYKSSDKTRVK